jgi:hypothetical protein
MMSITMSADAANPMVLICFGRATRRSPSAVIESQGGANTAEQHAHAAPAPPRHRR